MQSADQLVRVGRAAVPLSLLRQPLAEALAAARGDPGKLNGGGMHADEAFDGSARRRLAAFIQPQAWHHCGKVGPPHARHEGCLLGRRHGAGGGAKDIGHARRHAAGAAARADRADAAGMGIDHACRDGRSGQKAKFGRRLVRQAVGERGSGRHDLGADPCEFLIRKRAQPHLAEIGVVPARLMREIGPFAGHGAGRASLSRLSWPCCFDRVRHA